MNHLVRMSRPATDAKGSSSVAPYYIGLFVLWGVFALSRQLGGLELISDEEFYVTADIGAERKRIFFLQLAQSFGDWQSAQLAVSLINLVALLVAFAILTKINLGNATISFFQIIYFAAVANYIFRDVLILTALLLMFYAVLNMKRRFWVWALALLCLIPIMADMRLQHLVFYAFACGAAYVFSILRSNYLVAALGLVGLAVGVAMAAVIGQEINIYGITLTEYVGTREERHDQVLTPVTFVISFVKHYFAPIPTSLLERIFFPEGLFAPLPPSEYGWLDDTYRLIYKVSLYLMITYVVVHWRVAIDVLKRWRFRSGFLIAFSLSNSFLYTLFAFGGGHERVKVFSTFFIFFIAAGIMQIMRERRLARRVGRVNNLGGEFQARRTQRAI